LPPPQQQHHQNGGGGGGKGKGRKGKGKGKGKGAGRFHPYGAEKKGGGGKGQQQFQKKKRPEEASKMPNFKGRLNEWLAKKFKRTPNSESELVFATDRQPGGFFVCTLKLNMTAENMDRESANQLKKAARPSEDGIVPFQDGEVLQQDSVGDAQPERKMAEQTAARAMLELVAPEQYQQAISTKEAELEQIAKAVGTGSPLDPMVHGDPKSRLNQLLMKVTKRSLTKNDVKYTSQAVEGGIQAQCELRFRGETYVGEVRNAKKDAECSVAEIILGALEGEGHMLQPKPVPVGLNV